MTHKGKPEVVYISIVQSDGSVAIMQFATSDGREATAENIEAEITKAGIPRTSWRIIDPAEIPPDRAFRDAWKDAGKIEVDMPRARSIHMDRIRAVRNAKLAETDVEVARALEKGENTTALAAKRQALRDIPQTLDLSGAATVEELRAIWPDLA